jgi:hypothetical protein
MSNGMERRTVLKGAAAALALAGISRAAGAPGAPRESPALVILYLNGGSRAVQQRRIVHRAAQLQVTRDNMSISNGLVVDAPTMGTLPAAALGAWRRSTPAQSTAVPRRAIADGSRSNLLLLAGEMTARRRSAAPWSITSGCVRSGSPPQRRDASTCSTCGVSVLKVALPSPELRADRRRLRRHPAATSISDLRPPSWPRLLAREAAAWCSQPAFTGRATPFVPTATAMGRRREHHVLDHPGRRDLRRSRAGDPRPQRGGRADGRVHRTVGSRTTRPAARPPYREARQNGTAGRPPVDCRHRQAHHRRDSGRTWRPCSSSRTIPSG